MNWLKLKSLVLENIESDIRKRINFNSTRYGNCSCGRFWITLDKVEIANFCTRAYYNKLLERNDDNGKYDEMYVNYGELSRQNAYESCWDYIHTLTVDEALQSNDPLIQTLAVLDKRVGKGRLQKIKDMKLHPLAQKMFQERFSFQDVKE